MSACSAGYYLTQLSLFPCRPVTELDTDAEVVIAGHTNVPSSHLPSPLRSLRYPVAITASRHPPWQAVRHGGPAACDNTPGRFELVEACMVSLTLAVRGPRGVFSFFPFFFSSFFSFSRFLSSLVSSGSLFPFPLASFILSRRSFLVLSPPSRSRASLPFLLLTAPSLSFLLSETTTAIVHHMSLAAAISVPLTPYTAEGAEQECDIRP